MKKFALLLFVTAVAALVIGFIVTSILLMPPKPETVKAPTSASAPAATAVAAAYAMTSTATTVFEVYKIPQEYYNSPCQKPAHLTFHDWMTTLPMPPYEAYAFDCSQMAAYVEWLSENCDHRATIVGASFEDYGHLWVLIDIGGVPFAYESGRLPKSPWVPRRVGEGSTRFHYDPDTEWESIYYAPWAHSSFEQEFAWWVTYPTLVTTVRR